MDTEIKRLPPQKIKRAEALQPRSELSEDIVKEYAADMKRGDKFPPVVAFRSKDGYWLADGFHRVEAADPEPVLFLPFPEKQRTRPRLPGNEALELAVAVGLSLVPLAVDDQHIVLVLARLPHLAQLQLELDGVSQLRERMGLLRGA